MKRFLMLFGTRPEAIKLHPVWREMKRRDMDVTAVSLGQHHHLLDDICEELGFVRNKVRRFFSGNIQAELLKIATEEIISSKPDAVIAQGDTLSAWAAATAAYFLQKPVIHIEAGIRSFDRTSPFPEETLRYQISSMSSFHFCPSPIEMLNLHNEMVKGRKFVTGQTGLADIPLCLRNQERSTKILCTLHRRESTSREQEMIFDGIKLFLSEQPEWRCNFIHHHATKSRPYGEGFALLQPLGRAALLSELSSSKIVITDSGGLQEEAEYLGIPCVVARHSRDRGHSPTCGLTPQEVLMSLRAALALPPVKDISDHSTSALKIARILHDPHGSHPEEGHP